MNRAFLLAGLLLALGGALFVLYRTTYLREETGGPKVRVVVAAEDIGLGAPMQLAWLRTEELPSSYVEPRHIPASELRSLIGLRLAQSVRAGEAVLRTDLSPLTDRRRTLSTTIPEGARALSIRAPPESGHGGLLRPGDRVDVLLTVGDVRIPDSGRAIVLAQNVPVLSVGLVLDRALTPGGDGPRADWQAQLSLQVTPEQAQALTLARERGRLRTVLRNPNDPTVLADPAELREPALRDPDRRQAWLRRAALPPGG